MASDTETTPTQVTIEKLPPELFLQVGDYLGRKDVYNAIRVNKRWFHQLTDLLWRSVSYNILLKVPECKQNGGSQSNRRQFYASKIRKLFLNIDESMTVQSIQSLQFTSIRDLWLNPTNGPEVLSDLAAWFLPFENTDLCSFRYTQRGLTAGVVNMLRRCSRLKDLAVHFSFHNTGIGSVLELFEKCHILQFGEIIDEDAAGDLRNIVAQVLSGLLRSRTVKSIKLRYRILNEVANEIVQLFDTEPLSKKYSLQQLKLCGSERAITPLLFAATTSLTALHLTVFYSTGRLGSVLPSLSGLTTLCLVIKNLDDSSFPTMEAISGLTQLRHLTICPYSSKSFTYTGMDFVDYPEIKWLTDETFRAWISRLSQLHELLLDWNAPALTESAIISIGRSCPHLESCDLRWKQDLAGWRRLKGLHHFPQVKSFALGELGFFENEVIPSEEALGEMAEILRSIFPKMEGFWMIGDYRITRRVNDSIRRRLHLLDQPVVRHREMECRWKEEWMQSYR